MQAASSPRTSALLVIDLQLGMFNGERLAPIHDGDRLLANVQAALQEARHLGAPVIFVRHAGPQGHPLEHGSPSWHIHPAIAPAEGETIVDKSTPDSFHETSLISDLRARGLEQLIVMGAQTEICVDTTCRRAFSLGVRVALVSDGHSTWDNDTLTPDQIIGHTNKTLAGWFVQLRRADEVGTLLRAP
jgi:nicotinamidase-related amidase